MKNTLKYKEGDKLILHPGWIVGTTEVPQSVNLPDNIYTVVKLLLDYPQGYKIFSDEDVNCKAGNYLYIIDEHIDHEKTMKLNKN